MRKSHLCMYVVLSCSTDCWLFLKISQVSSGYDRGELRWLDLAELYIQQAVTIGLPFVESADCSCRMLWMSHEDLQQVASLAQSCLPKSKGDRRVTSLCKYKPPPRLHKIVCFRRPQGNKPKVMLDDSGFPKDYPFQGNLLSILGGFPHQFLVSSSNFNPGCAWVGDFRAIQSLAPKLRMILRKSVRCLGDLVLIQFFNSKLWQKIQSRRLIGFPPFLGFPVRFSPKGLATRQLKKRPHRDRWNCSDWHVGTRETMKIDFTSWLVYRSRIPNREEQPTWHSSVVIIVAAPVDVMAFNLFGLQKIATARPFLCLFITYFHFHFQIHWRPRWGICVQCTASRDPSMF